MITVIIEIVKTGSQQPKFRQSKIIHCIDTPDANPLSPSSWNDKNDKDFSSYSHPRTAPDSRDALSHDPHLWPSRIFPASSTPRTKDEPQEISSSQPANCVRSRERRLTALPQDEAACVSHSILFPLALAQDSADAGRGFAVL